jgi:hypothetical protein
MRKPDWDIDRARGEEAEQLVRRMRTALAVGSCEVKRDDRAAQTGRVYIEQECFTANGWKPSGLAETKAVNWVFVLYDMRVIVWMPVWLLRNIAKVGKVAECRVGSHPTRGVVIPVDRLLTEARLAVPFDERQAA